MGRENNRTSNNKQNLKMIIMIVVKMSAWGSPNVQYLDKGVAGQKGWEILIYRLIFDFSKYGLASRF